MDEDLAVLESDGEDLLVDILVEFVVEGRGSEREKKRERSNDREERGSSSSKESTDLLTRRVNSVLSLRTVNESRLLGVEAVKTLGVFIDEVTDGREEGDEKERGREGRRKGQLEGRAMGRRKATVGMER